LVFMAACFGAGPPGGGVSVIEAGMAKKKLLSAWKTGFHVIEN
jgi:hypothetical protein